MTSATFTVSVTAPSKLTYSQIACEPINTRFGLALHIGVPDDSNSNVRSLPLVGDARSGFTLRNNHNWQPNRAQTKSGGIYADSAVSDGRTAIAMAYSNVTETIQLTIHAENNRRLNERLATLQFFVDEAKQFKTTRAQIEPVYLSYWEMGAPGAQYAIIYDIDVATAPMTSGGGELRQMDITLEIEREPFWRSIPPFKRGDLVGEYIVFNRLEIDPSGGLLSQNYFDIDGDEIAGDAPALLEFEVETGWSVTEDEVTAVFGDASYTPDRLLISRSTKHETTTSAEARYVFNAADGGWLQSPNANAYSATLAKTSTTDGVFSNGSAATQYVVDATYTSGTKAESPIITWGQVTEIGLVGVSGSTSPLTSTDTSEIRGRFACVLRCDLVSGTSGDMQMWLRFIQGRKINPGYSGIGSAGSPYIEIDLPKVYPTAVSTSGTFRGFYMGDVTLPIDGKYNRVPQPLGIQLMGGARGSGAAAAQLRVLDLFLLPVDECGMLMWDITDPFVAPTISSTDIPTMYYDNTGYYDRKDAMNVPTTLVEATAVQTARTYAHHNGLLTWKPGYKNRYHTYIQERVNLGSGVTEHISDPNIKRTSNASASDRRLGSTVNVYAVPRWVGVRDE